MNEIALIWGSFFAVGALFTVWENLKPAVNFGRRPDVKKDIGAFGVIFFYFLLVGVGTHLLLPVILGSGVMEVMRASRVLDLPLWLRVIIFYLVWDMLMYWVHRAMHHPILWSTHKWHHAPKAIWWFVGVRGSLPHILLTYLPFLSFYFMDLPAWLAPIVSVSSVLGNAWMHVNVTGKWMKYLEYFLVTPRSHRIHHSDNPLHYGMNLGSMFSIWDRMFGTFVNPETLATEKLTYGNGEELHPVRLAIGL